MPREFQMIADHLLSDGALRDFYIHGTNPADWNAAIRLIRSRLERGCFTVDGASHEMPLTFEAIEQIRQNASPCLHIPVAGAYLNCHFFCDAEIELDFRPEDYRTPRLWSALCMFFQDVVDIVGKPGVVTHENAEDDIIEKFEPRRVEQAAPPSGGGRTPPGDSLSTKGPPSVS